MASGLSSFSTAGLILSNVTEPGPRYLVHVTITGIGLWLRGFAPEFDVHFASSATQTVSARGALTFAVRCMLIPRGPWTDEPFSSNRRTGGVLPTAASMKGEIS